jgi:hypothetical protein
MQLDGSSQLSGGFVAEQPQAPVYLPFSDYRRALTAISIVSTVLLAASIGWKIAYPVSQLDPAPVTTQEPQSPPSDQPAELDAAQKAAETAARQAAEAAVQADVARLEAARRADDAKGGDSDVKTQQGADVAREIAEIAAKRAAETAARAADARRAADAARQKVEALGKKSGVSKAAQ